MYCKVVPPPFPSPLLGTTRNRPARFPSWSHPLPPAFRHVGLAPAGILMRVFDPKSRKTLTKQTITLAAAVGCLEHIIHMEPVAVAHLVRAASEVSSRKALTVACFVTTNCRPSPAATLPNMYTDTHSTLHGCTPLHTRTCPSNPNRPPHFHSIPLPLLRSTPPRSPQRKHTCTAHSTQHYARQQKPHTTIRIQAQQTKA